jgi:hypothetical protein
MVKGRKQIETLHPAGEQPVGDSLIGMIEHGKASLELAVQEARALGHHYIRNRAPAAGPAASRRGSCRVASWPGVATSSLKGERSDHPCHG